MKKALVAGAMALGLIVSACGEGKSDTEVVADTTQEFIDDMTAARYGQACDALTSEAKAQLTAAGAFFGGGGDCAKTLKAVMGLADKGDLAELRKAKVEAADVSIKGDTATVAAGGDETRLVRKAGKWLIDMEAEDDGSSTSAGESETGTEAEDESASATPVSDCDDKGINSIERNEGTCTAENGWTVDVVNAETKLTLDEMDAELVGIRTADAVSGEYSGTEKANGTYVVVSLRVTNRTDSPATFSNDQVRLVLDDKNYSHDSDAEMAVDDSLNYEEIQPDETLTGTVVFDVPVERAGSYAETGNLVFAQFSDASGFGDPELPVGYIRTYS
jgi:hypothetical protein